MYEPPEQFFAGCQAIRLELSDSQVDRLGRYLHLLLETNKKFNLTGIRDLDHAWMRHILEGLGLVDLLGDAKTLIDVGSGGGVPGVVLAIMRPDVNVALLEATGKKAKFLAMVKGELGLTNTNIINDRAETIGQMSQYRGSYDLAVARAVGPMRVLVELTLPLVKVGGRVLAMKGASAERELDRAGDALMKLSGGAPGAVRIVDLLPNMEDDAVVVEIAKADPTPKMYPRLPGMPKSQPL